ncbi:MAG: prolyl oligopeptidase family serine peptidase [Caulobacter sp.]|nr:prolyl oligopeptidase family serine peptidase [Caulobacter sp.]
MTPGADTLAGRATLLASGVRVLKPAGTGPFPVALQMHGCAGSQPFQNSYAAAAVKAGVAVVIVDSFKPRGMSRLDGSLFVCTGATLRGAQRAGDLHAMLHWLKAQPWADADRVLAAGWSHGGWTIMDAFSQGPGAARMTGLRDADPALLGAVKGAFLVYPYASFPSLTSARGWQGHRPRVFAVLGGKDQVVGTAGPLKALNRLKADGLSVDVLTFPDATHAFDDDDANDPRTRYRADLRATAEQYYVKALTTAFA